MLLESSDSTLDDTRTTIGEADKPVKDGVGRIGLVIVLGVAFLLIFSAFNVVQTLASSVLDKTVAFWMLAVLYLSWGFGNLFVGVAVLESVGVRWSLVLGAFPYAILDAGYAVAVGYEHNVRIQWAIVMPCAVFIGLGASVLWTAHGTYLSRAAPKNQMGLYSGIFWGIFGLSSIIGPISTALLLRANIDKSTVFKALTGLGSGGLLFLIFLALRPEPTPEPSSDPLDAGCEPSSVEHTNVANTEEKEAVSATPLERPNAPVTAISEADPQELAGTSGALFMRTIRVVRLKPMLLIAPVFWFVALEQAFFSGTLPLFINHGPEQSQDDLSTKLYLSAALGGCGTLASFFIGRLGDFTGSRPILTFDLLWHTLALSLLTGLSPRNNLSLLFPVVCMLGISDAMLMTQIYTLLGSPDLLPNHTLSAKFAVYQLHKSVAAGITFVASRYMLDAQGAPKMEIWMPLHIGILGLGVAGVWMLLFKRRKRDSRIGGDSLA